MRRPDERSAGWESRKPSSSWASCSSAGIRARASSSLDGNPDAIACVRSSARSRRTYDGECISRRAGAKGNADEQSTHRTQGRERVSQALDRVRKAARLKKDEKFTALLHHINLDLLREAFFALKRDAAPGVDGVTWRTYEADLDAPRLDDLRNQVTSQAV